MKRTRSLIFACLLSTTAAHAELWVATSGFEASDFYLASPVDASLDFIGTSGRVDSGALINGLDFASPDVLFGTTPFWLLDIDPGSLAVDELAGLSGQAFGAGLAVAPDADFLAVLQLDLFSGGTDILVFDAETFDITEITPLPFETFAADFRSDGVLVGIEDETNDLWTIDPFTGEVGFIGEIQGIEGIVSDMAASPHGDAWVITAESVGDETINRLYELDPFTGDASLVGVFDVPPDQVVGGIAFIPAPSAAGVLLFGVALATHAHRTRGHSR